MTEIEGIRDQLERSFYRDAWHGAAVKEVLEGVSAEQARRRPIADAHSIWELVLHMTTWKTVVLRRLEGDPMRDVPPDVDWPPVTAHDGPAWEAARTGLEAAHTALAAHVATLGDQGLDQAPAPGTSTRYVLLHGVIQHDLYHAGQIAVLKKG